MAGTSNITGDESIIFADNASFDGTERGGKMTTNGQIWIGSTVAPHVRLGSFSAVAGGGLSVVNGAGSIAVRMLTPYALGSFTFSGGFLLASGGDFGVVRSNSGGAVEANVQNTSNTASSSAISRLQVAGSAAGNAYQTYQINGEQSYAAGVDNVDNNWKITNSNTFTGAGSTLLQLTSAGAVSFPTAGFTTDGVLYSLASGVLASTAAGTVGQVLTSNGAGVAPTYQENLAGLTWTDVTGATQTIAVEGGYVTDRGGGVTYTLPSTAILGESFQIVGKLGIATITPNANQQLLIGNVSGTVGVTGTCVASNVGDCITFVCITAGASSVWRCTAMIGIWTLS